MLRLMFQVFHRRHNFRRTGLIALAMILTIGCFVDNRSNASQTDLKNKVAFRGPTSLAADRDFKTVLVANKKSGSVSVVDLESSTVLSETKVGKACTDVVRAAEGLFLVTDFDGAQICGLQIQGNVQPKVIWRMDCIAAPYALSVSPNRSGFAVGGKWSRQVSICEFGQQVEQAPAQLKVVDLPFCVGSMCWLNDDRLLVADEFGNGIALVNKDNSGLLVADLKDHRTGGIALSANGKQVGLSDQRLNPLARSTRNDVHWGLMVSNQIRWLDAEQLRSLDGLDAFRACIDGSRTFQAGRPENAKADLEGLALSEKGVVAIAVGGANELAIGNQGDNSFAYVKVGKRPVDVICSGTTAVVANQLDDSVSVVDIESFEVRATISLGERPDSSDLVLGEQLFFDASLSHDGWMSCQSCHVEGHTNGALNDNFSDESFSTPKQVISLLGHADTLPLTWNGRHADFETQMKRSIESTMQSDQKATEKQNVSLAAFVKSLPGPPSVSVARKRVDAKLQKRGQDLFANLECIKCHAPPAYTTPDVYEVDVSDENGETRFNPPSLIGLGQRDRYFHDGRFTNLEQVLLEARHQLPRELSADELSDILEFLKSL